VWDSSDQGTGATTNWAHQSSLGAWTGGAGDVSGNMTGLTEQTTYVFRMMASSAALSATAWSEAGILTTPWENPRPVPVDPERTFLAEDGATVECTIREAAADSVTLVWAYSDQGETDVATWTSAPGGDSAALGAVAIDAAVSHAISGLDASTDYFYRFLAANSFGSNWTETASFETLPEWAPEGTVILLPNGDFTGDTLGNGSYNYGVGLDAGWLAKNGDNSGDGDWAIQVGTPGTMTQTASSGSGTRMGQGFSYAGLSQAPTGTGWNLVFSVGGTGGGPNEVWLWAGSDDGVGNDGETLIAGTSDSAPSANIVTGSWDLLVDTGPLASGSFHSIPISQDLANYDIMVLKIKGKSGGVGSVYTGFALTRPAATAAPVADFTASVTSGTAPLEVTFTDSSSNFPDSWEWDFDNDGTVDSTERNPTFTFNSVDTYDVKLTATNAIGPGNVTKTGFITVSVPVAPVADFTATPVSGAPPLAVSFTDTSSNFPDSWQWDFENDGTVDSTEQNPSHTYPAAGSYAVKLTVGNGSGSDSVTKTGFINVSGTFSGLINGDFSNTTLTHGVANETALDQGWYAKNADDGVRGDPRNWSAGATVGTAGLLTQVSNDGSNTRMGQYFSNALTGTGWSFEFDLGGTAKTVLMRVWAGTSAGNPNGNAINGGNNDPPDAGLVDSNGWTEIVNTGALDGAGHYVFSISQDLGDYDVMVIKIRGSGATTGTTYDNFQFVQASAPADIVITSVQQVGTDIVIEFTAAATTDYKLTESADLNGGFADTAPLIETTTDGSGVGILTWPIVRTKSFGRVEEK